MNDADLPLSILEATLNASTMGVLLIRLEDPNDDSSFRILFANRATERHWGILPQTLIGRRSEEVSPALRERGFIDLFIRVLRSGKPEDYEDIYYADNVVQAAFSGHVERVAESTVTIWFENATERKRMEAEAAQSATNAREAERHAKLLKEVEAANAATVDALDTYELVTRAAGEALWEVGIGPDGEFLEGRVSSRLAAILGYDPAELPPGVKAITYVTHPDDRRVHLDTWHRLLANPSERAAFDYRAIAKSGEILHFRSTAQLALDKAGKPRKAAGSIRDITEQHRAEAALRERIALSEEQRALIDELSTPILDVWNDVIALPIMGTLDDRRAMRTTTALLDTITRRGARFALVDLTGVSTMDAATAEHVVRIAQAVALLGAEVLITGVQPEVARALVDLGVDLSQIATRRDLRQGIGECTARLERERRLSR